MSEVKFTNILVVSKALKLFIDKMEFSLLPNSTVWDRQKDGLFLLALPYS